MSSPDESSIRVLLVDDHELVRIGLRSLLERQPGVTLVGEAGTAAEARQAAARLHPDIVLMDIRLPDGSGIAAARDIRSADPSIRVLFLTSYADDETLLGAWFAGAQGFVLKQIGSASLVETIKHVVAGRSVFDQTVAARVQQLVQEIAAGTQGPPPAAFPLSPQEQRVVQLVAEGKTNKEIGDAMNLSEKTIKNYLGNVFEKLHVTRRSQVAAMVATQTTANVR
jgi:DNA-binding NarL/FixJ family response regulator